MTKLEIANLLKNKSILITGGTGFFGKNLCEFLVEINREFNSNIKIYSMARRKVAIEGVSFLEQDLTKEISIHLEIDFVIHTATPVVNDKSTSNELLSIIINGTQNIISWSKLNKVKKILFISSGAVYGAQPSEIKKVDESYFEKVPVFDENNAYASGKRISELMAYSLLKDSSVEFSIARGFAFSGKYLALDQHFAIGNFVKDAIDGKKIKVKGDGTAIRSYMDNIDLCFWTLAILLKGRSLEAYNLGSDQEITIKELALTISRMVPGTEVQIENEKNSVIKSNRYVPSTEKAQSELNLKLTVTLEESIQKMLEIYRKER